MFRCTARPCRYASDDTIDAAVNGCMYTGCTATSGASRPVAVIACWATSQGSAMPLSVYTSIPVHPAASLQRATSATARAYSPAGTSLDCGQVE